MIIYSLLTDAQRDSFVSGESTAVMIIEKLNHTLESGAPALTEILKESQVPIENVIPP